MSSPSPTPSAYPSAADANRALNAFNRAFYLQSGDRGYYRARQGSNIRTLFWRSAELLEMVEDAYQSSHKAVYGRMVGELAGGFTARYGTSWMGHHYNDDVMWAVIACIRAYDVTGRRSLLTTARRNFDGAYARAWSGDFGGGLWWTTDRQEKNACVNAPATIAAVLLFKHLHRTGYLTKAKALYTWERSHLYEADGRVDDNISLGADGDAQVDRSSYTYNQGTFVGAADLLQGVTRNAKYGLDARQALDFTHDYLTTNGVLRDEGTNGDGGGFKGIFMRYAVDYTKRRSITDYDGWFARNAQAAWRDRNAAGLIGHDWGMPTGNGPLASFDCSSAVVLLQVTTRR